MLLPEWDKNSEHLFYHQASITELLSMGFSWFLLVFFFFTSLAIKKAIVHISLTLVFAQAVEGLKGEVVYTHNNTLLCLFQYHSAPG